LTIVRVLDIVVADLHAEEPRADETTCVVRDVRVIMLDAHQLQFSPCVIIPCDLGRLFEKTRPPRGFPA
jgi:hypothetical protein